MTDAARVVQSSAVAIEVRAKDGAVEFGVHVSARDSRPGVGGEHARRLRVRVSSAPERGRANKEVVSLLARALGAKRREVKIVSGLTWRDKLVRVAAADPKDAAKKVTSLGGE